MIKRKFLVGLNNVNTIANCIEAHWVGGNVVWHRTFQANYKNVIKKQNSVPLRNKKVWTPAPLDVCASMKPSLGIKYIFFSFFSIFHSMLPLSSFGHCVTLQPNHPRSLCGHTQNLTFIAKHFFPHFSEKSFI